MGGLLTGKRGAGSLDGLKGKGGGQMDRRGQRAIGVAGGVARMNGARGKACLALKHVRTVQDVLVWNAPLEANLKGVVSLTGLLSGPYVRLYR